MRRFLSVLLALALVISVLSSAAFADAAGTSYTLQGTDATVSMPEGWLVATRASKAGDADSMVLDAIGVSFDRMISYMEQNNVYLYGYRPDTRTELYYTTVDYSFTDFNRVSDTMLDFMKDSLTEELGQTLGVPVEMVEYYRQDQAKFVVFRYQLAGDGGSYFFRQYYTVYENKAINLTFNKTESDFTEAEIAEQKTIVDSLRFGTEPVKAEEKTEEKTEPGEAARYTDPDNGFSFMIPAGWTEEPLGEDRQVIKAKFCSGKEAGLSVVYGCMDVYATLNADGSMESAGVTRKNLDDYVTTEDMVRELDGMTVLSRETYGGCDFVLFSGKVSVAGISMTNVFAYSLKNGYLINFQFGGSTENAGYPDFIGMLSSIDFD